MSEWNDGGPVTTEQVHQLLKGLFAVLKEIQNKQREHLAEQQRVSSMLVDQVKQGQRLERRLEEMGRRFPEIRDELEQMLKVELLGRLGNLETQTGHRVDELSDRVRELEGGSPGELDELWKHLPSNLRPSGR